MSINFKNAPFFSYANILFLAPMPNGSYHGLDEDKEPIVVPANTIEKTLFPLYTDANDIGVYIKIDELRRPFKASFNSEKGNYFVESEENKIDNFVPINYDDFRKSVVRVDSEGKYICSLSLPLHEQLEAVKRFNAGSHLSDIQDNILYLREQEDDNKKMEVGFYDIQTSELDDGLTIMDVINRINDNSKKPLFETHPFFKEFGKQIQWFEIKRLGTYQLSAVRVIFKEFLKNRIGDFPIENIVMTVLPKEFELDLLIENSADLISSDKPFEMGNIMPGYKTSNVRTYNSNGLEIIVFEDMMAKYAYAYPSTHKLEQKNELKF